LREKVLGWAGWVGVWWEDVVVVVEGLQEGEVQMYVSSSRRWAITCLLLMVRGRLAVVDC
jgi:hypothetical protein